MIPQSAWFALAFFAFLSLIGIESKLGKIADELAIFRKSRTTLGGGVIPLKVHITKLPKE